MISYFNRNKWWMIAFLLLVAMNIATLTAFWIIRDKKDGPPPALKGGVTEFLVKELGLDSAQKKQLQGLVMQHRQEMRDIRNSNREVKDSFFALLKEPIFDEAVLANAVQKAAIPDQQTLLVTFHHFQKVRSICTDVQKRKFDNIIQEVLRMSAPGNMPPPPPGRDGHPHPDGPPPGGEEHRPPPPHQ